MTAAKQPSPSDEELARIGWEASGGRHAMTAALNAGDFDEVQRQVAAHNRALFEAGCEAGREAGLEAGSAEGESYREALDRLMCFIVDMVEHHGDSIDEKYRKRAGRHIEEARKVVK